MEALSTMTTYSNVYFRLLAKASQLVEVDPAGEAATLRQACAVVEFVTALRAAGRWFDRMEHLCDFHRTKNMRRLKYREAVPRCEACAMLSRWELLAQARRIVSKPRVVN